LIAGERERRPQVKGRHVAEGGWPVLGAHFGRLDLVYGLDIGIRRAKSTERGPENRPLSEGHRNV